MKKTLVKNSYELYQLLKNKYGKRFYANETAAMMGEIEGSLDSKKIIITFKENEYLLISTSSTSKDILTELQPLLMTIMGDELPICSYDLQSEGLEKENAMPTIEWDIVAPEKRLKEIINGRAFSDNSKILNLKLYNAKDITDYLENEQDKENRIKNARIYGMDPGCIRDINEVNNLDEVNLYLLIDAMAGHIWRCKHEMAHGRIPYIDLTEEQYALEYMIYQTKKFGVDLKEPTIDKHVTPTNSYKAWYKFYDNHFKRVLNNKQWNAFLQAKNNGLDVSEFMPEGNWKDELEKPIQKKLQ